MISGQYSGQSFGASYFHCPPLDASAPLDVEGLVEDTEDAVLSVDIQAALAQMIDYIDRRGEGYIRFVDAD